MEYFRTNQRIMEQVDKVKREKKSKLAEAKLVKQQETRHRALTSESEQSRLKVLICKKNVNSTNPKGQRSSNQMTIRVQPTESGSSWGVDKRGQSLEGSYSKNFESANITTEEQTDNQSEEDHGSDVVSKSAKVQV